MQRSPLADHPLLHIIVSFLQLSEIIAIARLLRFSVQEYAQYLTSLTVTAPLPKWSWKGLRHLAIDENVLLIEEPLPSLERLAMTCSTMSDIRPASDLRLLATVDLRSLHPKLREISVKFLWGDYPYLRQQTFIQQATHLMMGNHIGQISQRSILSNKWLIQLDTSAHGYAQVPSTVTSLTCQKCPVLPPNLTFLSCMDHVPPSKSLREVILRGGGQLDGGLFPQLQKVTGPIASIRNSFERDTLRTDFPSLTHLTLTVVSDFILERYPPSLKQLQFFCAFPCFWPNPEGYRRLRQHYPGVALTVRGESLLYT